MAAEMMQVTITLPHQLFWQSDDVLRLVVETAKGSVGLKPRRLDCVFTLRPGILLYETKAYGQAYMALDHGLLLKRGHTVSILVRRAVKDDSLEGLQAALQNEFLRLSEQENQIRTALERLESGFIRRMMELKRHG